MNDSLNTNWQQLQALPDEDIDFSDIPKLDDTFFQKAELTTQLTPPSKQPLSPKP